MNLSNTRKVRGSPAEEVLSTVTKILKFFPQESK